VAVTFAIIPPQLAIIRAEIAINDAHESFAMDQLGSLCPRVHRFDDRAES
jgi:hypothetical protein